MFVTFFRILVCYAREVEPHTIDRFINEMTNIGREVGVAIEPCRKRARIGSYEPGSVGKLFDRALSETENQLQLLMFILPQNDQLYQEIKLVGDVNKRVTTQCINVKSMSKIK